MSSASSSFSRSRPATAGASRARPASASAAQPAAAAAFPISEEEVRAQLTQLGFTDVPDSVLHQFMERLQAQVNDASEPQEAPESPTPTYLKRKTVKKENPTQTKKTQAKSSPAVQRPKTAFSTSPSRSNVNTEFSRGLSKVLSERGLSTPSAASGRPATASAAPQTARSSSDVNRSISVDRRFGIGGFRKSDPVSNFRRYQQDWRDSSFLKAHRNRGWQWLGKPRE